MRTCYTYITAELLRYKQAVHRQLHSNSVSSESPLDVGIVLRVPRSNESVFDDDNSLSRTKAVRIFTDIINLVKPNSNFTVFYTVRCLVNNHDR